MAYMTAVPMAAFARKLMGPLLIVVGLFLAGVLRLRLSLGQHVSAGQVIGYEGNTGNSTGAHLHWMVEMNGTWKNPRLFL